MLEVKEIAEKKFLHKRAWLQERKHNSLSEVFSSVQVPKNGSFWKKLMAFAGPGLMISVGYMDPGNWATDIAGGAQFGYAMLSVILISNFFAIILQYLSLKLGIATERDLAQACHDSYSKPVSFCLWILCEVAIAACDLAEVIGAALALNLLFHIPLTWGVLITAFDVLLILYFQRKGFRLIESIVAALILIILLCFGYADPCFPSCYCSINQRLITKTGDCIQPIYALHSNRDIGGYCNAAQFIPALQYCANPQL